MFWSSEDGHDPSLQFEMTPAGSTLSASSPPPVAYMPICKSVLPCRSDAAPEVEADFGPIDLELRTEQRLCMCEAQNSASTVGSAQRHHRVTEGFNWFLSCSPNVELIELFLAMDTTISHNHQ